MHGVSVKSRWGDEVSASSARIVLQDLESVLGRAESNCTFGICTDAGAETDVGQVVRLHFRVISAAYDTFVVMSQTSLVPNTGSQNLKMSGH